MIKSELQTPPQLNKKEEATPIATQAQMKTTDCDELMDVTVIEVKSEINDSFNNNTPSFNNNNNDFKLFETPSATILDINSNNNKNINSEDAKATAAAFRCEDCGKITNSQRNLQRHRVNCKLLAAKRVDQQSTSMRLPGGASIAQTPGSMMASNYVEFTSYQQQKQPQQQRFYYQTTTSVQPQQQQQQMLDQAPFSTAGTSATVAVATTIAQQQSQQRFATFGVTRQQQHHQYMIDEMRTGVDAETGRSPASGASASSTTTADTASTPAAAVNRKRKRVAEPSTTTTAANSTTGDFECEACHKSVCSLRSLKRHRSTCKVLQSLQQQPVNQLITSALASTPSQPSATTIGTQRSIPGATQLVNIQSNASSAPACASTSTASGPTKVASTSSYSAATTSHAQSSQHTSLYGQQYQQEQQQQYHHSHSQELSQQRVYGQPDGQQQEKQQPPPSQLQQQSSQQKVVDVVDSVVKRLRKQSTTPQQTPQPGSGAVQQQRGLENVYSAVGSINPISVDPSERATAGPLPYVQQQCVQYYSPPAKPQLQQQVQQQSYQKQQQQAYDSSLNQQMPYEQQRQHLRQQQQSSGQSNKCWASQQQQKQQQKQQPHASQQQMLMAQHQQRLQQQLLLPQDQQRRMIAQQQHYINYNYSQQQQQAPIQAAEPTVTTGGTKDGDNAITSDTTATKSASGDPKAKPVYRFLCPECDKQYSCRKNIKRHRQNVHSVPPQEAQDSSSIKKIRLSDEEAAALITNNKGKKKSGDAADAPKAEVAQQTQQHQQQNSTLPTTLKQHVTPMSPTVMTAGSGASQMPSMSYYYNPYAQQQQTQFHNNDKLTTGQQTPFSAPPIFEDGKVFPFGSPQSTQQSTPQLHQQQMMAAVAAAAARQDANIYYSGNNSGATSHYVPTSYGGDVKPTVVPCNPYQMPRSTGDVKIFAAPLTAGYATKYPITGETPVMTNGAYGVSHNQTVPFAGTNVQQLQRVGQMYRHHSFDNGSSAPYQQPYMFRSNSGTPSGNVPSETPIPSCSTISNVLGYQASAATAPASSEGNNLADLDYWDQIKSDVDRPFLSRSHADDLEMARIAEDLKRSAEGNDAQSFHDFSAPNTAPYLTSPNFASRGFHPQSAQMQHSPAFYAQNQYHMTSSHLFQQQQSQLHGSNGGGVANQVAADSQAATRSIAAVAATTMPVELAEADSTFWDEEAAAAAAASGGGSRGSDYSKRATPISTLTPAPTSVHIKANQIDQAARQHPQQLVGANSGSFYGAGAVNSPLASPTYARAPLSAPAYSYSTGGGGNGSSTYFRSAAVFDGAISNEQVKMVAANLSPMYSNPQQQQLQYMPQLRLPQQTQQQQQTQLPMYNEQQSQQLVAPKKKSSVTTAFITGATSLLYCGGCPKGLATEYSLKRHRAACLKYKELQQQEQQQQQQQQTQQQQIQQQCSQYAANQTTGSVGPIASFNCNSADTVPDPDSTTFWQSNECASSSSGPTSYQSGGNGNRHAPSLSIDASTAVLPTVIEP